MGISSTQDPDILVYGQGDGSRHLATGPVVERYVRTVRQ